MACESTLQSSLQARPHQKFDVCTTPFQKIFSSCRDPTRRASSSPIARSSPWRFKSTAAPSLAPPAEVRRTAGSRPPRRSIRLRPVLRPPSSTKPDHVRLRDAHASAVFCRWMRKLRRRLTSPTGPSPLIAIVACDARCAVLPQTAAVPRIRRWSCGASCGRPARHRRHPFGQLPHRRTRAADLGHCVCMLHVAARVVRGGP